MPGPPVTIGCAVTLTPGAAGPPDSGFISVIPQAVAMAGGMPLAVAGSICQMVNSVSGVPYPLPIPSGGSMSVTVNGMGVIRVGDQIPAGPGILMILGPPAAPFVNDQGAP
ncbi:MAG TPA: hypothetical protein VGQ19_09205 [Burkholderiales bacterium]|nr:hypothetical protein [Burkholderiales bacterium]